MPILKALKQHKILLDTHAGQLHQGQGVNVYLVFSYIEQISS